MALLLNRTGLGIVTVWLSKGRKQVSSGRRQRKRKAASCQYGSKCTLSATVCHVINTAASQVYGKSCQLFSNCWKSEVGLEAGKSFLKMPAISFLTNILSFKQMRDSNHWMSGSEVIRETN